MAFPTVRHCIISEGVRQELGNKATILGFYGITPDVVIGLAKFPVSLDLFFLLIVKD